LLRFSSIGDVLQTLSVAGKLGESFPGAEIHWVTREEFAPLLETHPHITKVWTLKRGPKGLAGLEELKRLGTELKRERFTHIYDAHNNLRSRILCWQLKGFANWRVLAGQIKFLRRSIYRWRRFLLFKLRINRFPKPFPGQLALLEPLQKWELNTAPPNPPQLFLPADRLTQTRRLIPWTDFVTLAPSASYPLKRWPVEHWIRLIQLVPDCNFVILGGPEDQFVKHIVEVGPERVLNLAGKLSLFQSADTVELSRCLISNDTGLLHVAEQIGKPCIALMGPAPFGYPGRPKTRILERDLWCRPCSKHGQGPCVNPEFQKCLRDITPEEVAQELRKQLHAGLVTKASL
jgi:ADP-heptose:LPS heptosyltransferase